MQINPVSSDLNSSVRRFLLVEDDDDHAKIVERSLRADKGIFLVRVSDGVEALKYLRREGQYQTTSRPDVVLLDLKLPKKDGHGVLSEIKEDVVLRTIPVIILTTSDAEGDKQKAYENDANSYLVKPLERDSFQRMIQDLGYYWGFWNKPLNQLT